MGPMFWKPLRSSNGHSTRPALARGGGATPGGPAARGVGKSCVTRMGQVTDVTDVFGDSMGFYSDLINFL